MPKLRRKALLNRPDILTPQHECWNIFVAKLEIALSDHVCTDMPERPLTRAILLRLAQESNINVEATLDWYTSQDGYCDCEVLYHVVGKHAMVMEWHALN